MAQAYTIHIHAIPLSDDDGKRANSVTKEEFQEAVKKVSDIFKPADVRFAFDSSNDWKPRKSTALNSLRPPESTEGHPVDLAFRDRTIPESS